MKRSGGINLLPKDLESGGAGSRAALFILLAFVALIAGLALVYFGRLGQTAQIKDQLTQEQKQVTALQKKIDSPDLQAASKKKADLTTRTGDLKQALGSEISMPRILNDLAAVTPADVWIRSLSVKGKTAESGGSSGGSTGGAGSSPAPGAGSSSSKGASPAPDAGAGAGSSKSGSSVGNKTDQTYGTMQVESQGLCGQETSAKWLEQLDLLGITAGTWVSNSTKEPGPNCNSVTTTSTADLALDALTYRSQRLAQGGLP